MENINLEKYALALEKKRQIEQEIKDFAESKQTDLLTINGFLEKQEELIDASLDPESPEEGALEINSEWVRVKKIGNTVNTEDFVKEINDLTFKKLDTSVASDIIMAAEELGTTIKTSFNRSKFIKGLKDSSKERNVDITELIKAAEEKSSKKTIKFETKNWKDIQEK